MSDRCVIEMTNLNDDFVSLVCAPERKSIESAILPRDGSRLLVDGYLLIDRNSTQRVGCNVTLEEIDRNGLDATLDRCIAGSFNLVYYSASAGEYKIASDRIGSIPLYWASLPDGCIVSTNPVAILSTGLISDQPDWTACASLIYFGYPVRDRHALRQIRLFPENATLTWHRGYAGIMKRTRDPLDLLPKPQPVHVDEMAELVRRSCERLFGLSTNPAHLQSAGMDSRLILAALPSLAQPACFTYGRADSTEVPIAKQVASARGAPFHHILPNADEVADALDSMFSSNGLMVYPDRYLISKKISDLGFDNVFDGFLGDVLLGGTYYSCDRGFGVIPRVTRLATLFVDQSVRDIGIERISRRLYDDISEVRDLDVAFDFIDTDFSQHIRSQRDRLLEDIKDECSDLSRNTDSLAILYRRFLMKNRARQAVSHQGVMCRQSIGVLYPFTNDNDVLDACLGLSPETTAYRRYYIDLFKSNFKSYADIPYGGSLIPLRSSAWLHNYHKLLFKMAKSNPQMLAFVGRTTPISPDNWSSWLRDSPRMREKLQDNMIRAGVAKPARIADYMRRVGNGSISANGKLLHIATVARWLSSERVNVE